MTKYDKADLLKRIRSGRHIVDPKKPTIQMTQREAFEWELECLEARLSITTNPKQKPGLIMRMQEIQNKFLNEEKKKVIKAVYNGPFDNEKIDDNIDLDDEADPDDDKDLFINDMNNVNDDEPDPFENEASDVVDKIKDDPLFE